MVVMSSISVTEKPEAAASFLYFGTEMSMRMVPYTRPATWNVCSTKFMNQLRECTGTKSDITKVPPGLSARPASLKNALLSL